MNLIQPYGPRDEGSTPATDLQFVGVDERNPPSQVVSGYVCGARNSRFRNGRCEPREGIGLLPWMKGNGLTPFTETYGGGTFSDPNQSGEWILIAAEGGVWKTRPNRTCTVVPLPEGVTLTQDTFRKFVQANAAIVLLRGLNDDPLVCYDLEQGFQKIAKVDVWAVLFDHATNLVQLASHGFLIGDAIQFDGADSVLAATAPELTGTQTVGDNAPPPQITIGQTYFVGTIPDPDHFTVVTAGGTQLLWNNSVDDTACDVGEVQALDGASEIPPALNGIFENNRLYLINDKDTLVQSDLGDFTRYAPIPATFRINQGDAFSLLALRLMNENTLLFFKSGNVRKALGVGNDITQAQGPLKVTDEYGIAGVDAHAQCGNDVYFVTNELRVTSVMLTELNKEQQAPTHLSDPLVKTFGRINAAAAGRIKVVAYDEFLMVALPLDDAALVSRVEQVPAGAAYNVVSTTYVVGGLTAGQRYRWTQGATTDHLMNTTTAGVETYGGDVEFVAGSIVALVRTTTGTADPITDSLRAVTATGVCNAVAVYDFKAPGSTGGIPGAWAGTDESSQGCVCVRDWFKFTYGGRTRLGFIGADGWLHLYGEGFEDEVAQTIQPYVDVLWDRPPEDPEAVSTFAINDEDEQQIAGPGAPYPDPVQALQNVYGDGIVTATVELIADGVRVTQKQAGIDAGFPVPMIYADDVQWVGKSGWNNWALIDFVGPVILSPVGVEQYVLTRGYMCVNSVRLTYGTQMGGEAKRFVCLALQLRTWNPTYTVRTIMQGKGTAADQVTAEVRDRLQYFDQFDKQNWDPSNSNDDFNAPGRQDYSWQENGSGMQLGSGVDVDGHQEFCHRVPVNERGLWMQVEMTNSQGRVELIAAAMEGLRGEVLGGVAVN